MVKRKLRNDATTTTANVAHSRSIDEAARTVHFTVKSSVQQFLKYFLLILKV